MKKFNDNKTKGASKPADANSDNVVDIAMARMKSGAVVKEDRYKRAKYVVIAVLCVAGLAAYSSLDFVFKSPITETQANGDIVLTLEQDSSGHYLAMGKINDQSVRFIVDTGATEIAIPLKIAEKIGLPLGREFPTYTANGVGTAYESKIESIQLGGITLTDIAAHVTEGLPGEEALLGMSFLSRTRVETDQGVMKIIY